MHTTPPDAAPRGIWPTGAAAAAGNLLAGSVLVLAGVNGADLVPPLPGAPDWAWLPLLVLGCAGLLFRRRNVPLMLAVTGTAAAASAALGGGIITYLLMFELFYAGILFGSPRVSRGVQRTALTALVVLPVTAALAYQGWGALLLGLFQALIVCLVPVWWAGSVRRESDRAEAERQRAETERLRAERTAELAELNQRMAVAAERSAMARDLHDAIAGHLSAVALQSAAALAAEDPALGRRVLVQVRAESVQALAEMRSMIGLLESAGTDPVEPAAGGLAQLGALAASARLSGNPVDLDVEEGLDVPVLVSSTAYRIVQESLTNAVRHAPGAATSVSVQLRNGVLELDIRNTLPAAARAEGTAGAGRGSGLRNMQLRTAQLGGSFTAGPVLVPGRPGQWRVTAALPALPAGDSALISVPNAREPQ